VAASVEHHALMKSIRPATLIDVGANVGQFSLLIRTLHPEAYIHAFEPLSRPSGRFARLFKGDERTTLHRCAIGPLSGSTTMHVTGEDDGSSLLVPAAAKTVGVEQVAVRRLDEVLNATDGIARPVLLKLDTQGFELPALHSCGLLLDKVDFVYVEVSFMEHYLGQALADEVVQYLFGRGFSLTAVNDPAFDEAGRCMQADFLFSRRSAV
jgi:FkbM family methyltransferase